jgi:dihydrofolate synthase/folylpolyglutamate synthase
MNQADAYQQTLDYLYSYVDFSMTRGHRYSADQFDLGRMRTLVTRLGNPEGKYPSIHIAGTKGKGSVAALCQSALMADGYRTGLYTSPHLHDYAERIRINGAPISHSDLIHLVEENKPVFESIPKITTFEITTALAFLYFARQEVDVAVIEVGLGGRLDATNVVIPIVAVITSLSYDHTHLLGDTLAEIAGEKAGIIKDGIPVILSPQKDEARQVIERIAAERSAPLIQMGRDYLFEPQSRSLGGQSLLVWQVSKEDESVNNQGHQKNSKRGLLSIPLLGSHQVQNAATAYAALQVFSRSGFSLRDDAIRQGFSTVNWPGRFEILQRQPAVVIDCAHNRDSALKVRQAIDDYFPNRRAVLVFGASEDKDIAGMFAELAPITRQVIATKSFHPRAIEPERLQEIAHQFGLPVKIVPDVPEALEEAIRFAGNDSIVLVTGSIFIAAGAREAWIARKSDRVPA